MAWLANASSYIAAILAGGGAVALFNAWRTHQDRRTDRKSAYLLEQLRHLYGPLHFLCSHNASMFDYSNELSERTKKEYVDGDWSTDPDTTKNVHDELSQAIATNNKYVDLITANNRRIYDTIYENYALIDSADETALQDFALHVARHSVEFAKGGAPLPFRVRHKSAPINFFTRDFANLIAKRFSEKQHRLAKLRGEKPAAPSTPPPADRLTDNI